MPYIIAGYRVTMPVNGAQENVDIGRLEPIGLLGSAAE